MSNELVIEQKQGIGSNGQQIGVQYNQGLSPEKACKLSIDLFMDNFPKLQDQAMKKAEEAAKEFCETTVKKLIEAQVRDFSPFSTPDVQYVLLEAQTNYARFSDAKLLSILSDLVVQRVVFNEDDYFKIVLDKAISVVPSLTQSQLDTLTLLFYYKKVKFGDIKNLEDLENHFLNSDRTFLTCGEGGYSLMNSLGCLDLDLCDICERTSKAYLLNEKDVESICPINIKNLHSDYGPSHVGIIIAIMNAKNKASYRFDPRIWINI